MSVTVITKNKNQFLDVFRSNFYSRRFRSIRIRYKDIPYGKSPRRSWASVVLPMTRATGQERAPPSAHHSPCAPNTPFDVWLLRQQNSNDTCLSQELRVYRTLTGRRAFGRNPGFPRCAIPSPRASGLWKSTELVTCPSAMALGAMIYTSEVLVQYS